MSQDEHPLDPNDESALDTAYNTDDNIEAFPNESDESYVSFTEEASDDLMPHDAPQNEDQIRINILEEQLERTKDQMIRALAEAENARKRAVKEREDASKFAVSRFSRDILSVADNLRRALESIPAELLAAQPEIKNLTDGIEATERELLRAFEKNGIQKTEPMDERFDPNFHEVMFEAPMPDKEGGIVIQVIEPGYTINGRILRPARVGISKAVDQTVTSEPGGNIDTQA